MSQPAQPPAANDFDMGAALLRSLRGTSADLSAYLHELQRDVEVAGAQARLHAYFLPVDANGRFRVERLAEFLCERIVDYAIPRRLIAEAEALQVSTGSTAPIVRLERRARTVFTHLANTGEGGELLLFAMAEALFGFTQILCKMSLKTAGQVHYHGADGVYAAVRPDGGLNIYWGESKVHGRPADAIRECLASLAPFLSDPDSLSSARERDVLLVNEFANFTDERLVAGLRAAFEPDNVASLQTRHCGIGLTAFDCAAYRGDPAPTMAAIVQALQTELPDWQDAVGRRVTAENLAAFDLHIICVPLPQAEAFRTAFLRLLGVAP